MQMKAKKKPAVRYKRMAIERPPLLQEGEYFIGKFLVKVVNDVIHVTPRQSWSHNHQGIDSLVIDHMDANSYLRVHIRPEQDSLEVEQRILKLLRSKVWRPRKFKSS